jgi:two-component system, LytTR family, sensor kinase
MKKLLTTAVLMPFIIIVCKGQKIFPFNTTASKYINWYNYATSYAGDDKITHPTILTAVSYNGVYDYFDNSSSKDALKTETVIENYFSQFSKEVKQNSRKYTTYDSAEIYFLAPNIFSSNAAQYEYRVLLNGTEILKQWSDITEFADSSLQINSLKKGLAFLGGYKAGWDNFLALELQHKNKKAIISVSVVQWKNVKPALLNIYPATELNTFLDRFKKSYDQSITETEFKKWTLLYKPNEIDSLTLLPKKLTLNAKDNTIIFYLRGDVYEKQALEYRVVKNGKEFIAWKPNDFDNNLIWLKDLLYGDYVIEMRYRSQRHNITSYPFKIKPAWYQQTATKIATGSLLSLFLLLAVRLWRQKTKGKLEKVKKEKLNLELKALKSQLNPHFVFNALSSIQGLINKNETETANHYLTVFSNLLRQSLNNKDAELVPLETELQMLETYIKIEQLRFRFKYELTASSELYNIEIPSMLIQPLIENAIKYGVSDKSELGLLQILFSKQNLDFVIDIIDNGNGFNSELVKKGIGLKLVEDRIRLLNDTFKYGQQIKWSIDSREKLGTSVKLIFQNWL